MTVVSPPDAATSAGRGALTAPRSARRPDSHRPDHGTTVHVEVVPARAHGVEILGDLPGSGYRQSPGLVRRADGQTVQLTRLLYLVLEAIDGERSYVDIAAVVSERAARLVTADNVRQLSESKLRPLGLLRRADGSEPEVRKANPLLAVRFRVVISNPRLTRRITAPFAFLFHPAVVALVLTAFVLCTGWVLFEKGLAAPTYEAFDKPGLLLLIFAITLVSTGFHEFGHAAACRYSGATPGAMGMGLYLIWPAFYTNVDDSYRLGRAGRIRVDLGGLYFNAIVAVAMFALWSATGWDALLLVIPAQVLQMLRQLPPFVRFDGYHILADLTGVPDLYAHIKPTLLSLLPTHWGRAESKVLKPWARLVVTLWVLIVVPLLLLSLALMVAVLPRVAATAWQSLNKQALVLADNWAADDYAAIGVRLLSILAICLPVLGMVYLLIRLVRRVVRSVWRATAGRPVRRLAAILAGIACVAAIAWAWWPQSGRYQPIQEHERGTVTDVMPVPNVQPIPQPGSARGAVVGQRRGAVAVLPTTSPVPTKEHPRLALVMVPRSPSPSANTTPPATWVFPFNPPKAPGDGDNQALAVNTADGSTVYDVAFALIWVTDDDVDNKNEAWALASCQDCTTVAVAFQVVLVVGQADVVIPQNISVAVNYACVDCLTQAVASQLVVTLPDGLSDDAKTEIAELWQEIQEFGQHLQGLSVQEIQAELTQYEAQILAIIQDDTGILPTPGATPATPVPRQSPSATASPSGTTSEMPSPTPSRTPSSTPVEPTPSDGTTSATPSQPATPTQTPSPTG